MKTQIRNLFTPLALLLTLAARAQTYIVLKNFTNSPDGSHPYASLTVSGSTLYGTTYDGGSSSNGTVFKINTDGTSYTVLKNFGAFINATNNDGQNPWAGVTLSESTLYGTTRYGGSSGYGTVFKISSDGTGYTVLRNFTNSPDGAIPLASLTLSDSTLYGTTYYGGSSHNGTVFKINTDGTGYTVLKNFTNPPDGANPIAGLTLSGNTLYGTTKLGGSHAGGTLFMVNTDGSGYNVLKQNFNNTNGAYPYGVLTLSGSTLYGTTSDGGSANNGTVFKINTDGTGYTVLKSFSSLISGINNSDGARPVAGMTLYGSTLYGTASAGGSGSLGTLFQLSTNGAGFTTLKKFTGASGSIPLAGVMLSGNTLYGTTYNGGSLINGTVFKIDLSPTMQPPIFTNGQISLTSGAISNVAYQVQFTTELNQTSWMNLGSPITATSNSISATYPPTNQQGFYRVVYQP